jgi:hypothetical protein
VIFEDSERATKIKTLIHQHLPLQQVYEKIAKIWMSEQQVQEMEITHNYSLGNLA